MAIGNLLNECEIIGIFRMFLKQSKKIANSFDARCIQHFHQLVSLVLTYTANIKQSEVSINHVYIHFDNYGEFCARLQKLHLSFENYIKLMISLTNIRRLQSIVLNLSAEDRKCIVFVCDFDNTILGISTKAFSRHMPKVHRELLQW